MSIDYYALRAESKEEACRVAHEGGAPLSVEAISEALARALPDFERATYDWGCELNWEGDGYIQVEVQSRIVALHHGSGGDTQLDALHLLLQTLAEAGLYVYDPQNSRVMDEYLLPPH